VILPKTLGNAMSTRTQSENVVNLRNLINYEVKERFNEIVEQMKVVQESGPMKGSDLMTDITTSLQK
jgi:hypothetical protein